jgi:DNA-directed RNA polymerase II subunit RPB1
MLVNLKRLIWNAHKTFKIDTRTCSDMHPMEIVEATDKLQERLKVVHGDDAMSILAQKNATLFLNVHLRATFASKRVLNEYRLTREAFEWIIDEIVSRFSVFGGPWLNDWMCGCTVHWGTSDSNDSQYLPLCWC